MAAATARAVAPSLNTGPVRRSAIATSSLAEHDEAVLDRDRHGFQRKLARIEAAAGREIELEAVRATPEDRARERAFAQADTLVRTAVAVRLHPVSDARQQHPATAGL